MRDRLVFPDTLRSAFKRFYGHISIIALCILAGLMTVGLESRSPVITTLADRDWTLPKDRSTELISPLDIMLANPLFGGEPVLIEPPPPAVTDSNETTQSWRLVGIVTEGQSRSILLENIDTGRLQHARQGELLPDGELLKTIFESSIEVKQDENDVLISLFADLVEGNE